MAVKVTRRTFIRGAGVTIGSAAVGVGSTGLDRGPVQETEAVAPLILYGAAAFAGSVALGWSLRHYEVIGKDDPPEGLTPDALHNDVITTGRTRKSTNASTVVDNQNIIDGIEHNAYIEGKLAAIEALNDQLTQSEVETAARDAANTYFTTVEKNLLKSWNESVLELENIVTSLKDHPDTSETNVFEVQGDHSHADYWFHSKEVTTVTDWESVTLADGDSFSLHSPKHRYTTEGNGSTQDSYVWWTPNTTEKNENGTANHYGVNPDTIVKADVVDGNEGYTYHEASLWQDIYTNLQTKITNVTDGLTLWVDSVYGDVQAGDIDLSDLITPRERAAMMADDEDYPQAVADLLALNIPVDFEREATIDIPAQGVTIRGTLGLTSPPAEPLTTGETYSPSTFGTTYMTYDISTGEGTWDAYESGIDGGIVTFTSEPHPETLFEIDTTSGETVDATTGEFSEGDDGSGNTVWTVDLSGELDDAITSIEAVRFYSEVEQTQYETVQLEDDFTITSIENADGEKVNEMDFTKDEPQDDSNYITQEEWNAMEERNQELIEKYEEAAAGGGPAGDLFPNGIVAWATNNPGKAIAGGGGIAAAWALLTSA